MPPNAHHEELIQIRAQNRDELQPFEQGQRRILRLLEHALLKSQQAELTIQIQVRVLVVRSFVALVIALGRRHLTQLGPTRLIRIVGRAHRAIAGGLPVSRGNVATL